jgi:hypothetical protein
MMKMKIMMMMMNGINFNVDCFHKTFLFFAFLSHFIFFFLLFFYFFPKNVISSLNSPGCSMDFSTFVSYISFQTKRSKRVCNPFFEPFLLIILFTNFISILYFIPPPPSYCIEPIFLIVIFRSFCFSFSHFFWKNS